MNKKDTFVSYYEALPEFENHNSVISIFNKEKKLHAYVAFHRGGFKNPAFGATRFMEYDTEEDAIRDVLRLSRLMSYKNAISGLPFGGAKGVIIKPKGKFNRKELLEEYAKHIERLNGSFITGTDVGLNISDLRIMMKKTKYMVGVFNNPEKATAKGVYYSFLVLAKNVFNQSNLKDLSFAIQGLGKVGGELLSLIYPYASKIYVADIDSKKIQKFKKEFPNIEIVDTKKIHTQKVDIFSPCALSHTLTSKTISAIKAKAICGAANNQLKSIEVGDILHKLGIVYCPDYLVNAGGLIAVAKEYLDKKASTDNLDVKLKEIGSKLEKILIESKKTNKAPVIISEEFSVKVSDKQK